MGIWNTPTSEGCTSMVSKNSCLQAKPQKLWSCGKKRIFSKKGVILFQVFSQNFPKHKRSNPRSQLSQLAWFYSWQKECRKFHHWLMVSQPLRSLGLMHQKSDTSLFWPWCLSSFILVFCSFVFRLLLCLQWSSWTIIDHHPSWIIPATFRDFTHQKSSLLFANNKFPCLQNPFSK